MEEYSLEDLKYIRTGYIGSDRNVDTLVQHLTNRIPGDGVLPSRWRWLSRERFMDRYEDLGKIVWSKAASYHMLMVSGNHSFRLWTDSADTCVVDVSDNVAVSLKNQGYDIEDIPESCYRKCKPLTKRCRMATVKDIDTLVKTIEGVYGIHF